MPRGRIDSSASRPHCRCRTRSPAYAVKRARNSNGHVKPAATGGRSSIETTFFFLRDLLFSRAPYIPIDARCQQEMRPRTLLSARCTAHLSRPLLRGEFLFQCFESASAGAAAFGPKAVTAHGACMQAGWQVSATVANAPVFSPPASQPAQHSQQL